MSASDAAPLPRLGEVFFDVRGDSRSMRLSWYADTGVAVFSIWQGGMCTGTFRLPIDDLPRMIETLQRGPERRRRPIKDRGRGGERADYQRSRNEPGYYGDGDYGDGDGGYDDAGHQPGAYDQGGYDNSGHEAGGYNAGHEGGYDAARHEGGGYVQGRYDAGHKGAGHGEGDYDDAAYGDSAGYPDVHGYGHVTADVRPRGSTSRSDVPAGTYWRQPDGYQPGEYHADGHGSDGYQADGHRSDGYQADGYRSAGYETDGYQSDSYQTDGYQTAAYPSGPADHAADAESELAGYGQERFVPPYVQARGEAYPSDNPVAGGPRRHGGGGPAYPADHGGVSAERHRYGAPPRSRPGYSMGSEDRLAADTPIRAPYSSGGAR